MDNLHSKNCLKSLLSITIVIGIPMCLFLFLASITLALGYLYDTDQEEFTKNITTILGTEVDNVDSFESDDVYTETIKSFQIQYWNGTTVDFKVPNRVWKASLRAYQKHNWCDPRFIVALAHSESSTFQNNVCSSAGACGVWQFMLETWNGLWPGKKSDRTNINASADAACRYTQNNGMINALSKGKEQFIFEFAEDPPVWNAYRPQAEYVWRAYQQIKTGNEMPEVPHKALYTYTVGDLWWQKAIAWYFKQLGLLPETLAYNPNADNTNPDDTDTDIGEGDSKTFMMIYKGKYVLTQGLHRDCAVDVARGMGSQVYSPINGRITQKYIDGLGNPTIRIENADYIVTLLHGIWKVKKGQTVSAGQKVGTENTIGNSTGPHVHFDALRRGKACVNPLSLVNTSWQQHGK